MQSHTFRTFLGANSTKGFVSLYEGLTDPLRGERRFLIKAGPGGGKSSFMKSIGRHMEETGSRVEYIHCSGDPDSLDGVYFPKAGIAVVDATAPHVGEPVCYGALDRYVDLGQFSSRVVLYPHRNAIMELVTAYKKEYRDAYAYLRAYGQLPRSVEGTSNDHNEILSTLPRIRLQSGRVHRRFSGAFSCIGLVDHLMDQAAGLTLSVKVPFDGSRELEGLAEHAAGLGYDTVLNLNPLFPEEIKALIIPEAGIGLFVSDAPQSENSELGLGLLDAAETHLRKAKKLHDELEDIYIPAIDFSALEEFQSKFLIELDEMIET